jgi:hypothetical protein
MRGQRFYIVIAMSDTKKTSVVINVREVCGFEALTEVDGKKLHKVILNQWGMYKKIEVNFARTIVSIPFLEEAIGQIILQLKKEAIIAKLKITGLSPEDKKTLNNIVVARYHSLTNAARFRNQQ